MANFDPADFLIVGGGVIGLRIAIELRRRFPDTRVVLLEKEPQLGQHASTRNSGVLHAGFYYSEDSFKARFSREGNARLARYCDEWGLRINRCGKLVVAQDAAQLPVLDELRRRGQRNGVELRTVSVEEAREIEPRVRTHERALFSPSTATVDPAEVVAAYVREAADAGVAICTGTGYLSPADDGVATTQGRISAGYVINAAGLYADRVARDFGFAERYRILPFKGLYLHARAGARPLRTNIYPVPDLGMPFLGVHLTVAVDGHGMIGPTALPALWREQYRGLANFDLREFLEVVGREGYLFALDRAGFRGQALRELPKLFRRRLLGRAARLADGIKPDDFRTWGPAGIRAQLLDIAEYRLENDFHVEGDDRSFHVLNAVSPAFTCAIPFAEYVLDEIERLAR